MKDKLFLALVFLPIVVGQIHGPCLSNGGLAGVIFGCIIGTIVAMLIIIFFLWRYLRVKKLPVSITEKFCYDNPQFKQTDREKNFDQKFDDKRLDKRTSREVERGTFLENANDCRHRTKKKRPNSTYGNWWLSNRDSKCFHSTESLGSISEYARVPLISKDFTGLGFGIFGNMRDGIYIKNLLSRGPAKEGGKIHEGDKIVGLSINFENMAYEDALTIISYASPYPVVLEIQKSGTLKRSALQSLRMSRRFSADRQAQFHPLIKSQSIDDIALNNSHPHSTLERKSKSNTLSNVKPKPFDKEKTATQGSPLVAVEKKEYEPLSKILSRKLSERKNSDSSVESFDKSPDARKVTVMADISQPPKGSNMVDNVIIPPARTKNKTKAPQVPSGIKEKSPQDMYNELSYEEKLQVLRLSYEDPEMSQSTPNLSRTTSDNEEIAKVHPNFEEDSSHESHTVFSHSRNFFTPRRNSIFPLEIDINSNKDLESSNLSNSSSSENMSSEFNKEQYEKLLYFQNQLARQQEELSKLGITIPIPSKNANYANKPDKLKVSIDYSILDK